MSNLRITKAALLMIAACVVLALAGSTSGWIGSGRNSLTLSLTPPTFLTAQAATNSSISDQLDQEAGISAWFQSPDPINLNNAAAAFRVIETQNADYIIGSVPVTGYPELFDAHVYVHKDGWILAYYLKQDPVSKIIDIRAPTIASTNLQSVISVVAGASGVSLGTVKHYDFRYPNATHILMVYEDYYNGTDFTIKIPSSYGYYERGFATAEHHRGNVNFWLDGVAMSKSFWANYNGWFGYGVIAASQLLPDVTHTVVADDDGVLIIIYREQ